MADSSSADAPVAPVAPLAPEATSPPAPATGWKRHVRFRWSLLLLFCFVFGGAVGWAIRVDRVAWARRNVFDAVREGDLETLGKCIRVSPELLGVSEDWGTSALHMAVQHPRSLEFLLDAGAEVDLRDAFERTPLHVAARSRSAYALDVLLARGADANARDVHGRTPLHFAARSWTGGGFEDLLEDLSAENGVTGRVVVAVSSIAKLVAAGADVKAADKGGRTPLHEAAAHNRARAVPLLLRLGAKVNARDGSGRTPLALASANGDVETVKALVKAGADPNLADDEGLTPLHLAVSDLCPLYGYGAAVEGTAKALLAAGAKVNAMTTDGRTVLHIACACGPAGLVDLLLQSGVDVTAIDNEGNTPLHALARNWRWDFPRVGVPLLGEQSTFEKMLEGADPAARNSLGLTPLDLARENGQDKLVKLLEEAVKKRPASSPSPK